MTKPTPVDLRSDTVTRPTDAMRAAIANAAVGDDQYGEDPTTNAHLARRSVKLELDADAKRNKCAVSRQNAG